jgi:hypothetical protein
MKKLFLILVIALMPLFGTAQTNLSQFEDNNEVTTIIVTQKAFEMMSNISVDDIESQEMIDLIKGLKQLKVYTTEDAEIGSQMTDVLDTYLKKSNLSELLSVNDKQAKVKVFVKEGKDDNHVTELLMLVNGIKNSGGDRQPETVILSITGDIYLDKISQLINEMNISGGEHIKHKENDSKSD